MIIIVIAILILVVIVLKLEQPSDIIQIAKLEHENTELRNYIKINNDMVQNAINNWEEVSLFFEDVEGGKSDKERKE